MTSTLRSVAESRFAKLTRREDTAMTSLEEEKQAERNKTARLRALRLATEAATIAERTRQLESRRRELVSLDEKIA